MLCVHPTSSYSSVISYSLHLFHLWARWDIPSLRCPLTHFLTSWPWPLTYDLDLWTRPRYPSTWPPCQNPSLYVRPFGQDSETDRQTDTHTDKRCQNYYTRHVSQTWGVKKNISIPCQIWQYCISLLFCLCRNMATTDLWCDCSNSFIIIKSELEFHSQVAKVHFGNEFCASSDWQNTSQFRHSEIHAKMNAVTVLLDSFIKNIYQVTYWPYTLQKFWWYNKV